MAAQREKYILTFDLGTGGVKAALFSTQGTGVAYEFAPTPLVLLPRGGAEQRPDDWWQAIKEATGRLLARRLAPVDDIIAVCATTQWSGTVAVDRNGDPLMNGIIWMDARGAPYVRRLTGGGLEVEGYNVAKLVRWLRLTAGIPGHAGKDSIAHILFIKNECPEIYRATYKFLEPKDYLNLKLTGQYAASYDSITLHWVTDNRRIANVVYDPALLRLVGVEREKLPDLKRAVDILGTLRPEVAAELGLNPDVQVVMGTPDVHSAALGSGAVRDYEGHLYIGTSAWLTCHVPFKRTDLSHNMASIPSAIPGRYFVANEQETAGECLDFMRDNILFHPDELPTGTAPADALQTFDRIVERAPAGSGGTIFTPWLYGERTPVEDHLVRGGFLNLSLQTKREQLLRAVYEGVAYNSRWLLEAVERFIGRPFPALNMIGGGANSNVWCQIHADVLNRPIRQVKDPVQANARGAAFLAAAALGRLAFEDIPGRVEIASTYAPNPAHRQLYDEMFREFVNIYHANRKIYRTLNGGRGPKMD